jgi:hypothetical protein
LKKDIKAFWGIPRFPTTTWGINQQHEVSLKHENMGQNLPFGFVYVYRLPRFRPLVKLIVFLLKITIFRICICIYIIFVYIYIQTFICVYIHRQAPVECVPRIGAPKLWPKDFLNPMVDQPAHTLLQRDCELSHFGIWCLTVDIWHIWVVK